MELYYIRHGQSQNNANWLETNYQQSSDPSLTDVGKEQARHLAEFLKKGQNLSKTEFWNIQNRSGFGFTHLYTSLMERAVDTAMPTAQALGLPLVVWPEIHEAGGIFSREDKENPLGLPGRPRSFFEERGPDMQLPEWLDESGWWNRPFETEVECQDRADQFLVKLFERHGDREGQPEHRVALISHGGFFMHLMCAMLKLPWRQAANGHQSWFLLNNCSISRFDIRKSEILISYLNRTDFLPDRLITG